MVFLVYKEVDFFCMFGFVKQSVKYVQCGLEYLILFYFFCMLDVVIHHFIHLLHFTQFCLFELFTKI